MSPQLLPLLGNSSLMNSGTADSGVFADRAESSEGKVAVTGVVSCASFGLLVVVVAGMVTNSSLGSLAGWKRWRCSYVLSLERKSQAKRMTSGRDREDRVLCLL